LPDLRLLAWELTRQCPLNCRHCRADASRVASADELSLDECRRLLDSVASFARPLVILTGGEPLARGDVYEIADWARQKGLRTALATCGEFLDSRAAKRLIDVGVARASISIDGATAAAHDEFRGAQGAFAAAVEGARAARAAGLPFQINTTVWAGNVNELPAILDLAAGLGAVAVHVFILVATGRARALRDRMLSRDDYVETLKWIAGQREKRAMDIQPTCAPQYGVVTGDKNRGGCLAGRSFAFVSHVGDVQPCGFLDVTCGNLRDHDLDLLSIWENARVLRQLRDPSANPVCGRCAHWATCGGCRARALEMGGELFGPDPLCPVSPDSSGT